MQHDAREAACHSGPSVAVDIVQPAFIISGIARGFAGSKGFPRFLQSWKVKKIRPVEVFKLAIGPEKVLVMKKSWLLASVVLKN